jgi:hypothetical protein
MRFDSMDGFSSSRLFKYTFCLEPLPLSRLTLPTILTYKAHLPLLRLRVPAPSGLLKQIV